LPELLASSSTTTPSPFTYSPKGAKDDSLFFFRYYGPEESTTLQ